MKTLRGPDVSLHHGGAFLGVRQRPAHSLQASDPHVTRHTSHVTRHTSHVTRHTSHVTRHTLHATRHMPHVTRHTYAADHLVNIAGISLERHVVDPRLQRRVNAGATQG
jgi:hypothetical protein